MGDLLPGKGWTVCSTVPAAAAAVAPG